MMLSWCVLHICSETLLYFDREAKKRRDQETNLWSEPGDYSHSERDDDRELYNLLQKRSRMRRGSQVSPTRIQAVLMVLILLVHEMGLSEAKTK